MKKFNKVYVGILVFLIITSLSSWGFLVHKTVNQLAIYELPKEMAPFFYANMEKLVYNAARPDTRRNTDSTEAPKHFIDLEGFGKNAIRKMPAEWEKAVYIYSKDSLIKYGYVPYQVQFTKAQLTKAFSSKNKDSILFYAADIGHYIADAHVPLHTTINYDGQLSDQKGLHSLWESMIPELEIGTYNLFTNHKATYLKKPGEAIWKAIRKANTLLPRMLINEKEVSLKFTEAEKFRVQIRRGKESKSYTTAFAKAYSASLKNTINIQLLSSSEMVADFWYTSWVDAGKPDLSALFNNHIDITEKLTNEKNAFNDNLLIQKGFLLSTLKKADSE